MERLNTERTPKVWAPAEVSSVKRKYSHEPYVKICFKYPIPWEQTIAWRSNYSSMGVTLTTTDSKPTQRSESNAVIKRLELQKLFLLH